MNFILPYNNIDKNNFSFIKPVKNRTIDNGLFYKLYYNNNLFIINTFMMNTYLEYKSLEIFPDKWEPLINKSNKVKINIPETNQCWNIPPPCISTLRGYTKNIKKT